MAKQKREVYVSTDQVKVQKPRPWWQWVLIVFVGLWVIGVVGQALNIFPDAEERAATQTATAIIAESTRQQRTAVAALTIAAMPTATNTDVPTDVPTEVLDAGEQLDNLYKKIDGIDPTLVSVIGSIVHVEANVDSDMLSEVTAKWLFDEAQEVVSDLNDFTAILSDGADALAYRWINGEWTTTSLSNVVTAAASIVGSNTPRAAQTPTVAFTPEAGLVTAMQAETFYVGNSANLRSCPRTNCSVVTQLGAGAAVIVDAVINGEAVNAGNAIWYRVQGQEAYVYSGVVSKSAPAAPVINSGGNGSGGNSVSPTSAPAMISTPMPQSPFGCNGIDDLNCGDFRAIGQNANAHLAACGDEDNLDGDGDGRACER